MGLCDQPLFLGTLSNLKLKQVHGFSDTQNIFKIVFKKFENRNYFFETIFSSSKYSRISTQLDRSSWDVSMSHRKKRSWLQQVLDPKLMGCPRDSGQTDGQTSKQSHFSCGTWMTISICKSTSDHMQLETLPSQIVSCNAPSTKTAWSQHLSSHWWWNACLIISN